jgi:hypothetical protein
VFVGDAVGAGGTGVFVGGTAVLVEAKVGCAAAIGVDVTLPLPVEIATTTSAVNTTAAIPTPAKSSNNDLRSARLGRAAAGLRIGFCLSAT